MYRGRGRGGARAAAALDGTAEERVGRLLRIGGEIGWGEFALEAPVCHLIRGVLESLAAATSGRPSTVVETACIAMGAPVCRFVAS